MKHAPGFLAVVDEARPRVSEITIDAWLAAPNALLIDVREDDEWAAGRLPHAIHIGRGVLERDIEAKVPDKGQALVLYCGGGYRSILAADSLQKMGYTNVRSLVGGIREWRDRGLAAG